MDNLKKSFLRVFFLPLIISTLILAPILYHTYTAEEEAYDTLIMRPGLDAMMGMMRSGQDLNEFLEKAKSPREYLCLISASDSLIAGTLPDGVSPDEISHTDHFYTFRMDGRRYVVVSVSNDDYMYVSILPYMALYDDFYTYLLLYLCSAVLCIIVSLVLYKYYLSPRVHQLTASKERMQTELEIAHDVQQHLVPTSGMKSICERIRTDAILLPAREVGGDLYDYVLVGDRFWFCVGDVSDKGTPSAIMMAIVTSLFHHMVAFDEPLAKMCQSCNQAFAHEEVNGMFCTFFMGYIDINSGLMHYVNAGHNPPLLNGKVLEVFPNLPLGVMNPYAFREQEQQLRPGDRLFLYTDGITEAMNEQEQFYGMDRLIRLAEDRGSIASVIDDVVSFRGEAVQNDDITILTIEYN